MSGRHYRPARSAPATSGRRASILFATALLAGVALVGVAWAQRDNPRPAARTNPAPTAPASPAADPSRSPLVDSPDATAPAPAADSTTSIPVRLVVAAIGVDTALQPLGLDATGALQAPSAWGVAGWYAKGIRPGDRGPAVIAGHVDSRDGPAVFYRLHELRAGQQAQLIRADGTTLTFVIDGAQAYPKDTFPTAAVYGPTADAQLRLITCTGDFNWPARSYVDNLVVSAHLAG